MNQPGGETKPKSPFDHTVVITVMLPILYVALRIMLFARGDALRLRALVANLDIKAVILGSVLPLGATLIAWLCLFAFMGGKSRSRVNASTAGALWVITVIVVWWAMPMRHIAINACILVALLIAGGAIQISDQMSHRGLRWLGLKVVALVVATLFVIVPIVFVAALDTWLPRELLRLAPPDGVVDEAYVLSSDETWTRYLDHNHDLHIVATPKVLAREPAHAEASNWNRTLAEITGLG